MTSQKLSNGRSVSSLIAQILKIAGLIITLVAVFDMLITLLPYQFGDQQWQIDAITEVVSNQGVLQLVGIVLFLAGFGIDRTAVTEERKAIWQDPRFWACLLASLLGLVYVLAIPLHLHNVTTENTETIKQIDDQAKQYETELNSRIQTMNTRIQAEIESRRQQINQLLTVSDEQIQQLIDNQQLTQEQAEQVRKFKADPKSVEPFLKKQEEELRAQLDQDVKQLNDEIGTRKQQEESTSKAKNLKSGLRIGIGSLILAIGFITVGWAGLRHLRQI